MKLDDLNDMLDIRLESEDYDSIGGYIIGLIDNLPEVGQTVSDGVFTFQVESLERNRIKWVRLWIPEPAREETDGADAAGQTE